MKSLELLQELISTTNNHIQRSKNFLDLRQKILNQKIENQWSILECCEHLNQYFGFYLPEISSQISKSISNPKENFTSGILGNYFAKSMLPKENMKKMNSPKDKNPAGKHLDKSVVYNLIKNLETLLNLLEKSKSIHLESVKIKTSISKLIRLKLGDTFSFIVNHNERHLQQAEKLI